MPRRSLSSMCNIKDLQVERRQKEKDLLFDFYAETLPIPIWKIARKRRGDKSPFRNSSYTLKSSSQIGEPFSQVEKSKCKVAKPFFQVEKSKCKVAKSFFQVEKPKCKVAKSFFQVEKSKCKAAKSFFQVEKSNPKTGIYKIKKTGIPQIGKPQKEENEHSPFREFVDF